MLQQVPVLLDHGGDYEGGMTVYMVTDAQIQIAFGNRCNVHMIIPLYLQRLVKSLQVR